MLDIRYLLIYIIYMEREMRDRQRLEAEATRQADKGKNMEQTINNSVCVIEGHGRLHQQYAGQQMPQPIFLELDPNARQVTIDYNAEIGNSIPVDAWNGMIRRYTIPLMSRRHAARLARTLRPLLERVCDGWERVWDGNRNVGRLNADAQDATDDIERTIANLYPGSWS
jgi:hypothetical protein